jgi:short-subunit dehydrogenase
MQPEMMTVLLTGACGGIGRALSHQLANAGANLYLTGRDPDELCHLLQELNTYLRPGQFIQTKALDLTDDNQVDEWIASIKHQQKPVNVLVNNAGVAGFDLLENQNDQDIERIMFLNSIVPMKLTRKLLPMLSQRSEARIVNVSSTFGAIGFPGYSVYSASKYAVRGFSQALARELSDSNVHVGCFLPRATQTSINSSSAVELNRELKVSMDSPETVATLLMKFISNHRREQAVGWPEKLLVRINSIFPAIIGNAICKNLPLIKQYAA